MSIENELIVSAKLHIHRLRAAIDQKMAEALLKANELCYPIPGDKLAELLETDHPLMTFEFDFHRRKKVPATRPRMTPPAGAPSKKRKKPVKTSAQDSDSDSQYQPRRRRRERSIIGASFSCFVRVGRWRNLGFYLDLRSPDSKPDLDDDNDLEDQLAILEELEQQEIELEQEAARKIQVRLLPTSSGNFASKVISYLI